MGAIAYVGNNIVMGTVSDLTGRIPGLSVTESSKQMSVFSTR